VNGDEIKNILTEIIKDVLNDSTIVLTRETTANDVEDWDSLSHINILVAAEKEFGIKFDMRELKPLRNVGDMIDLIQGKLSYA
jgi:acyl carrier protein